MNMTMPNLRPIVRRIMDDIDGYSLKVMSSSEVIDKFRFIEKKDLRGRYIYENGIGK